MGHRGRNTDRFWCHLVEKHSLDRGWFGHVFCRAQRWSAGAESSLTAPSFAGTPVVGEYLLPLDSALQDVVGGVNDFIAFKQALPIALNFLTMSGLALLVAFALAFIAVIISMIMARNRNRELKKYRATVDQLKVELEQVKWQISTGSIGRPTFEPAEDDTEVLPRRTR